MAKRHDDVRRDLFLQCKNEEIEKQVLQLVKPVGSWEKYTGRILRGWSDLTPEKMETFLYEQNHFSKEDVKVLDANIGLFFIH